MDAFSCAADVDGRIADEHRERGDDFEVDEGFDAEAADFREVGVAGTAHDENAEEQLRDDDLDEAQRKMVRGVAGLLRWRASQWPNSAPARRPTKDPSGQRAAGGGIGGEENDRQPSPEALERARAAAASERRQGAMRQ